MEINRAKLFLIPRPFAALKRYYFSRVCEQLRFLVRAIDVKNVFHLLQLNYQSVTKMQGMLNFKLTM